MTTLTPTRLAAMPRVNLLPPEIAAAARLKRLKGMLGLMVLATLAVVGAIFFLANQQIGAAEDSLTEAEQQGQTLQAEVNSFAEVPQVLNAVTAAQGNLATAMTPEIRWSFLLNDLSLSIPQTSRLVSMTAVNEAAAAQATGDIATDASGATTPLGTPTMGTVAFVGKSTDVNAVAAWLQSLARQSGYEDPYVQSLTRADSESTRGGWFDVQSSTYLGLEAASNRYLEIASGE